MPRLTLQVVTWNSERTLRPLLVSLRQQHFADTQLIIIDNASTDATRDIIAELAPEATLIANNKNNGFAGAHNQGILHSSGTYIAIINPDIVVTPEAFSLLVSALDQYPDAASVSGKLLKSRDRSGIIDATGLVAKKNRRFLNRGEGERDLGQYDQAGEVFGNTGALVVFRREALESVRFENEYFDEDFFAYKEDIDLAWRMRRAGWVHWYEPRAVFFHERRAALQSTGGILRTGRATPSTIARLSYRNHFLVLLKNDRFLDWFFPYPAVLLFELGKVLYLLVREPSTLLGAFDALRLLPRMLRKRALRQSRSSSHSLALRRWFL